MTDFTKFGTQSVSTEAGFDAGLRSFMLKVYNYMTLALLLSGGIAYAAGTSQTFWNIIIENKILMYVIAFAPLVFVLIFASRINKMSLPSAQAAFWAFAAINGLSLSFIFAVYAQQSIVQTFFITSATFGAISLYGYTTKRDLNGMGHFMMMGLFGLIIAMVANVFLHSEPLQYAISLIGVGIFVGLTAWDTQKLKTQFYMAGGDATLAGKTAIMGALNLYLDFINLFLFILRLMGSRR